MSAQPYVPLRVFSSFTMLEGAMEPKSIAKLAAKLGFPAVALTDRNGLYAAMAFGEACQAQGVQPVIGTTLAVARPDDIGPAGSIDWVVLLAQDEDGYAALCRLVSAAHLDRPLSEVPHVPFDALQDSKGLICLTAGSEGALAKLIADDRTEKAALYAGRLEALFTNRLYVELIRRGDPVEEAAEHGLIDLAYAHDLPIVATNPAQYSDPTFHAAHDAMLCIAQSAYVDTAERAVSSPHAWLKPAAEIESLFADLPEAIANTSVVAQRCAVAAPNRRPILPRLSDDEDETLRREAHAGLERRLDGRSEEDKARYRDRLDFEIDVITRMGFAGYFLIVADFIQWAKSNDIPVGPGRGSGAGSAVAWALTITDLDPIELKLLFERFLNPERVSMPDFDIDFCETHRDKVISYVQAKYGRDKVAQIITFGRLKARAVLKDTGRVLQMSYGQVDRLAKLVPNHPTDPWTLERALNGVSELAAEVRGDKDVRRLFDLAMKLEGLPRHSSTHAAGVVIGDRPLDQLVPLYRDPRSDMPVTQFDMKYVEAAGLVKFDFLGLKTLSVLKEGQRLLRLRGIEVDYTTLAWDDPAVFALLQRGDTVGVFQLESEGMRRTLAQVRPTSFGDIIALVSLYRPGPMDNIPLFGDRKNGRADLAYPHPLLEDVLGETYGIFVYQEQVMQAAQVLAGYSLGDADLLRRAMGKKIQAEMDAQRSRFVSGARGTGHSRAQGERIVRLDRQVRRIRFQQEPRCGLCVGRLSYGLAQSPLSGRILRGIDELRHAPDRQACLVRRGYPPQRSCLPGARRQRVRSRLQRRETEVTGRALRARRAERRRRKSDGIPRRRAQVGGAIRQPGRFRQPDRSQIAQPATGREPGRCGRLRCDQSRPRDRACRYRNDSCPCRFGARTAHQRPARPVRRRRRGGEYRADPATNRCKLDHCRTDGGGTRRLWFLFLGTSGRYPASPARRAQGQELRRSRRGSKWRAKVDPATMAGLVEDVRWRTSAKGRRYMMATISDASGQYDATVFDDEPSAELEQAAKSGTCGLMTVELDRRPGEEMPRVTVKRFQSLDGLARRTRLQLHLH